MREQFEVTEIQNKTRTPFVFDVDDYRINGRTEQQAITACEEAAMAKFHSIMVAAYDSQVAYCGANVLHYAGKNILLGPSEIIEREANN